MYASNNKQPKRSVRRKRGVDRSQTSRRTNARSSRSRANSNANQDAFERSSYVNQSTAGSSDRASAAYQANKYGNSTHPTSHAQSNRNAGYTNGYDSRYNNASNNGYVPLSPAAANSRYGQNAADREFVMAQRARKKKARRKRIVLIVLAVILALLLGGIGAAWAYIHSIDSNLRDDLDPDLLSSLSVTDSPSDPFYMLLIGVDKSQDREDSDVYGGSYRTDSMILARIDPQNKEVTLISVPRDTKIQLGTHGTQKINAAYAFGGPSLAVKTVSDLAGVPISHYAEIDFDGFKAVVDALGGVDVDVPMEINDDMAGGHVDAGEQTLNGDQALILCRSRHNYDAIGDGDSIRAANQRLVLSAIMKKVMSSDVATITNTVNTLADYVSTDYSVAGIVGLAQSMIGIDVDKNVYTAAVPTESVYENDIWYEVVQESQWRAMMDRVKQGLPPTEGDVVDPASGAKMASAGDGGSGNGDSDSGSSGGTVSLSGTKIAVKNGSGIQGCANEAAQKLTPDGAIVETGNADDFNYSKTMVIYQNASDKDKAQKVVDLLGKGQMKQNDGTYSYSGDILVVVGADWQN